MNNSEIRSRALSKAKQRISGLTFMAVIAHILSRGEMCAAVLPYLALAWIPLRLICAGGRACAGISAWRRGKTPWGEFFHCFTDKRLLAAGAAVECVIGAVFFALIMVSRLAPIGSPMWIACAAAAAVFAVICAVAEPYVYFAADMLPDAGAGELIGAGLRVSFGNFFRVLLMRLNLYWWLFLVQALVMCFMLFALNSANMALNILVSEGAAVVLFWAAGSYVVLGEAGLARELFAEYSARKI